VREAGGSFLIILIVTWLALIVGLLLVVLIVDPMGIFDVLIETVGYTVARLILPLLSSRRVYVQPLHSPLKKFNTLGYHRDDGGRIEIESTIAGFVGFVICLVVFFAVGLLIRTVV
jgi:hypothetical protein